MDELDNARRTPPSVEVSEGREDERWRQHRLRDDLAATILLGLFVAGTIAATLTLTLLALRALLG